MVLIDILLLTWVWGVPDCLRDFYGFLEVTVKFYSYPILALANLELLLVLRQRVLQQKAVAC